MTKISWRKSDGKAELSIGDCVANVRLQIQAAGQIDLEAVRAWQREPRDQMEKFVARFRQDYKIAQQYEKLVVTFESIQSETAAVEKRLVDLDTAFVQAVASGDDSTAIEQETVEGREKLGRLKIRLDALKQPLRDARRRVEKSWNQALSNEIQDVRAGYHADRQIGVEKVLTAANDAIVEMIRSQTLYAACPSANEYELPCSPLPDLGPDVEAERLAKEKQEAERKRQIQESFGVRETHAGWVPPKPKPQTRPRSTQPVMAGCLIRPGEAGE